MEQRPHPTLLRTAALAFVNNRAGAPRHRAELAPPSWSSATTWYPRSRS